MRRTLFLTVVLMLALSSGARAAQTYICRIAEDGNSGWIPEVLFIGRENGADDVVVSDPLILYYNDRAPVRGRVAEDNPRRITFVWSIRAPARAGQGMRQLRYTATYLKSAERILVSASPAGVATRFSGGGTCAVERR